MPYAYYFDVTDSEDGKMDKINREVAEFRKKLIHERYPPISYAEKKGHVQSGTHPRDDSIDVAGTPSGIADAEAAYEKCLGFAPSADLSALNTTGDTASPNDITKEETTTESGGGKSGNNVG